MPDSITRDVVQALGEYGEGLIPDAIGRRLRASDNDLGLLGVLFDAYTSIPEIAGPLIMFLAQRLKGRGGASQLFGEMIETIPATSRMLRIITGKSPSAARADMLQHWQRFKNNPRIGARMPTPTPPAVATESLSRVQRNIMSATNGADFTDHEKLILIYMFRILRIEGAPGSDVVAELEGTARSGKHGLIDTIKENASDIKALFAAIGDDFGRAFAAYEEMRGLERDGDVTSTDRAEWRKHAADFVRCLIPVFEFLLIGNEERHPEPATAAAALDVMDRLNMFAGLEPSSAFRRARNVQELAKNVGRGLLVVFALSLLYFLVNVQIVRSAPEILGAFAWWSTWIIIGGAALTIIVGVLIRRNAVALTGAFTAFAVATVLLTVAWVLATVFPPVPDWNAWWFGLLIVVCLDFIMFGLTQKTVQTVGGIPSFLLSFFPNMDEAKAAAAKIAKTNFLVGISATVSGAIVLVWAPVVFAYIFDVPAWVRIGGVALIAVAACAYGYMKRSATMKNYSAMAPEVAVVAKAHDVANLKMAYTFLKYVTAAVLIGFVAVWLVGVGTLSEAKDGVGHAVQRTVTIVATGSDKALGKVEEYVKDEPKKMAAEPKQASSSTRESEKMMNCGGKKVPEKKVKKDLARLNKSYKGNYCGSPGAGALFPCNCD